MGFFFEADDVIEDSDKQDYYVTSGGTVRRLRKGSQYLDGDKV